MKARLLLAALAAITLPAHAQKMQNAAGEAPGPWLLGTVGVGKGADPKTPQQTALKGLAIKVGEKGEATVAYDLDLCRMVGAWTGKFVTPMNLMSRGEYPTALGEVAFTTGEVPGFQTASAAAEARPAVTRGGVAQGEVAALRRQAEELRQRIKTEPSEALRTKLTSIETLLKKWDGEATSAAWVDPRPEPFGPLPPGQARFKGFYVNGNKTILKWDLGGTEVLEMPGYLQGGKLSGFVRSFKIAPHPAPIQLTLASANGWRQIGDTASSSLPIFTDGKNALAIRIDSPRGYCGTGEKEAMEASLARLPAGEKEKFLTKLTAEAETTNTFWAFEKDPQPKIFNGQIAVSLPAAKAEASFAVSVWTGLAADLTEANIEKIRQTQDPLVMGELGGREKSARWPGTVTVGELSKDTQSAYVVDTIKLPDPNSWGAPMFTSGLDFFPDGRAAVCTFHGDVFLVNGLDEQLFEIHWKRFASGLYHPLGLKIVKGEIYVTCRDGIWRLKDLNGDGECDFYEAFNFDVKVTKSFHEFVFDLQTDPAGNFYIAKAGPVKNGGRGFDEIMAHHGSLFRVSPDGAKLQVIATGFRAPNGIGVGPHGELTSGDNEGTWTPACKINWIKPGGFYGVVDLAHREHPPTSYDPPLCWLPKRIDNSGGGQVWVPEGERWGPWGGKLLHLSYGMSSLFGVLAEEVGGVMQGGVVEFPVQFQTGIMRGRFNPKDGQLYVTGLRGWQTNGLKNGALQRVRFTGAVPRMPIDMHVKRDGIELRFACSLDTQTARDVENWHLEQWRYVWSSAYGSPELSAESADEKPGELGKDGRPEFSKAQAEQKKHDPVTVKSVTIGTDDRTVFLEIPGLKPVMQMSIKYDLKAADGAALKGEVVNTIHALGKE